MELDKKKRYLIIVESPEKSRHITKIFRDAGYNNVVVMATIGHFTSIDAEGGYYNTGVDISDFSVKYKLDRGKMDNINHLKEQVKAADYIFIASDLDREGEAIAWSCREFLNIPKSKYRRIRYHEITKKAIFDAIDKASDIDENLVSAAHARGLLDIMFGYRLSQIARKNVHCKSIGRCQTAALNLIVERENEILNFKPEKYIDLYLKFNKNGTEFKAKYQGTDKTPVKHLKIDEEVENICKDCKGNAFIVESVEHKDKNEFPKPPFCTATFQQECASKLNLTVKQSMDCAQKLFENGKISYHRSDDEVMDTGFASELLDFVGKTYGSSYKAKKVQEGKKDENAQAGHECLRVLDLNLTPDKFATESNNDLQAKVYRIIYNRTIAAAMNPAVVATTTYNIYNKGHKFTLNSNELRFDGYKKVYAYKDEGNEKEEIVKETFTEKEKLENCLFEAQDKETQPKSRYKEASFIKELKDRGIGRPSTYATIIETIKSEDRGYTKVENKCLVPTPLGMQLIEFCKHNFPELIDPKYTSYMEEGLDKIVTDKIDYQNFMQDFYESLEGAARKVDGSTDEKCPQCGRPLVIRKGKYGEFKACSGYPECKYVKKEYKTTNVITEDDNKNIKKCPKCGKPMVLRKGQYGEFWGCSGYPECKTIVKVDK